MLARLSLAALTTALLVTTPLAAKEKLNAAEVTCSGVFGPDSSEALVKQTFGDENVVTGLVYGPEGSELIATTVFGEDDSKVMEFFWFDDDNLTYLSDVRLSPSQTAPGGVRIGMSVAEVETLNGAPFNVGGFWWDYGGYANIEEGALAGELDGNCYLSIRFSPENEELGDLDVTSVAGEVQVPSGDAMLETLDARVEVLSIGYAWPADLPQPQY